MKKLTKTFYIFSPPWKKVQLLFDDPKVFETNLFKSLSLKLLPTWYIKIRKRKIFNLFLRVEKHIPHQNTFLIYEGYDSHIFFYENGTGDGEIKVIRQIDGEYVEEKFLGYPIHWDFSLNQIPLKNLLGNVISKHWQELKQNKDAIHGDFTHSNILVDEQNNISIIDKKPVSDTTPIIYDLFYFYSYFLHKAKLQKKDILYENFLLEIFKEALQDEKNLIEQIKLISIDNFHFSKKEKVFLYWRERFENFLKKIIQ